MFLGVKSPGGLSQAASGRPIWKPGEIWPSPEGPAGWEGPDGGEEAEPWKGPEGAEEAEAWEGPDGGEEAEAWAAWAV
jgi:hypothetical protein